MPIETVEDITVTTATVTTETTATTVGAETTTGAIGKLTSRVSHAVTGTGLTAIAEVHGVTKNHRY